ncbi:MAG: hypothetical protein IJ137_08930 [Eubacterium sp.]|nr:hypothetical protein [Eubacterium sp.]
MRRDGLDRQIRLMLKDETRHIKADDSVKALIDLKIDMEEMEMNNNSTGNHEKEKTAPAAANAGRKTGKIFKSSIINIKRIAAAAALICLLVPMGLLASGKISWYVSSTKPGEYGESESWNDLKKMEKKVGFKSGAIEKFSNGFLFDNMSTTAFDGKDDSGNTLSHTKELMIEYKRGEEEVTCYFEKSGHTADSGEESSRKAEDKSIYKGIELNYYVDTYKFVPTDYKLTQEDKDMEEQNPDSFFISYGTDEVELRKYSYVNWEKEGIRYSLSAFDTKMTSDEMFAMAEEMVK